jgi:hypothetical protein
MVRVVTTRTAVPVVKVTVLEIWGSVHPEQTIRSTRAEISEILLSIFTSKKSWATRESRPGKEDYNVVS